MERLEYWISERQRIFDLRAKGMSPPWTNDPIFREYRFCNVHREDDRVTIWIRKNWRTPNDRDPALWHAMIVARFINWPDTLVEIGYPEPWSKRRNATLRVLQHRKKMKAKVFTGAYLVSTNGASLDKTVHVTQLFDRAWESRSLIAQKCTTLQEMWHRLTSVNGIGSFMAAQVIADLKYTSVLRSATDWWTWAAPGPGSLRGLNRVLGYPVNSAWRDADWLYHVQQIQKTVTPRLHAQDLQNCLCEFDKYERVLHGEGKPRARYTPHGA